MFSKFRLASFSSLLLVFNLLSCSEKDKTTGPVSPMPIAVWQKVIEGQDQEWGVSVALCPDGGFLVAGGMMTSSAPGDKDYLLAKTDSLGREEWRQHYGGPSADFGQAAALASDGGCVIAGSTYSFAVGGSDVYLIKTDDSGAVEWYRTYGGDKWETVYQVIALSDGGYVMAGWTSTGAQGASDALLIRTNAVGDQVFMKRYGGGNEDAFYAAAPTVDGGFILAGETSSSGEGQRDVYVMKVDDSGDVAWYKTFGGTGNDFGTGVTVLADGYAVCGWIGSATVRNHHGQYDAYVARVNLSGELVWESCYGGAGFDGCEDLVATPDGSFLVGGHLQNMTTGQTAGCLWKIDASGNVLWERTLGNSSEAVEAVTLAADGGYVSVGAYFDETTLDQDVFIVKTDASGRMGTLGE